MPRLTSFVLAGALGWPAVSFAQDSPGFPPLPERPGAAASGPKAPVMPTMPEMPKADGSAGTPGVPALPPGAMTARRDDLPPPTPTKPKAAPDASGMPGPGKPGPQFVGMPPETLAPVPPAPYPVPPRRVDDDCGCNYGGPCGWFGTGEVLWLRPRRRDPVALTSFTDGVTTTNAFTAYDGEFGAAYRVGGGFLTRGGWVFQSEYTQYKDQVAQQSFEDNPSITLTYTGPGQLINTSTTGVVGGLLATSWSLQFRTVDIMGGAVFSPSEYLDLIVLGGARLAWIDQAYRTDIISGVPDTGDQHEDLALRLQGGGARIGTEARLYLLPWLTAYGKGYTSLLLAHREDESNLITLTNGNFTSISVVRYEREEVVPILELATGLEVSMFGGRLLVGAGYEYNYVFELGTSNAESAAQPRLTTHNDISLDGFFVRVQVLW
jgi:hypothetical protein